MCMWVHVHGSTWVSEGVREGVKAWRREGVSEGVRERVRERVREDVRERVREDVREDVRVSVNDVEVNQKNNNNITVLAGSTVANEKKLACYLTPR